MQFAPRFGSFTELVRVGFLKNPAGPRAAGVF